MSQPTITIGQTASQQSLTPSSSQNEKSVENTQLTIATDLVRTDASSPALGVLSQPGSPISRKRAEVKDDDPNDGMIPQSQEQGVNGNNHNSSNIGDHSLPPLKRSKMSPPFPHVNLTEYRSSQEIPDDQLSPQTSPIMEPSHPRSTSFAAAISSTTNRQRHSPPKDTGAPVIPLLARSRTLEEMKPTLPPTLTRTATSDLDNLARSGEAAIGNLNLGTRSSTTKARTTVPERAMGVITSRPGSREASPATTNITMKSREATPIHVEDEQDQHERSSSISYSQSNQKYGSPNSSDLTPSSEDDSPGLSLLDIGLEDYDEDLDKDYDVLADTTVDELCNRLDSSESEDYDSYSEIDIHNIEQSFYEMGSVASPVSPPYDDSDPLCQDRLSDLEAEKIIEEAREHGISHIIEEYIMSGTYSVKKMLLMFHNIIDVPEYFTQTDLLQEFVNELDLELRSRKRLPHIHSLQHVVDLLKSSQRIMVLTGAGVSVSCGIPDFRSPDGIYSRLAEFGLEDPSQMFDLKFFRRQPETFYSFAKEIFPSNFTPSPSHHFIKLIEDKGKLLRNYTQNIDTLEQKAGIQNVLHCHGSFATASCIRCKHQVPGNDIKDSIFKQEVAYCKVCKTLDLNPNPAPRPKSQKSRVQRFSSSSSEDDDSGDEADFKPLMKPDIVFFGESLPRVFDEDLDQDRGKVDLLIVMGSSLKVAPVSDIMHQLPANIPQILINRTPITHMAFDVQLLGNCDTIVAELCRMAEWELKHEKLPEGTSNVLDMDTNINEDGKGKGGRAHWSLVEPNTYLFEGAILGDIEYENRNKGKSRKRGRLEQNEFASEDNGSEADDESVRRRVFSRAEGSFDARSVGTDGSDSDESIDTVYNTLAPASRNTSLAVPAREMLSGMAAGTTVPQSGSITEIHHSQTPLDSGSLAEQLSQRPGVYGGEDNGASFESHAFITETMPRDLGEVEPMSEMDFFELVHDDSFLSEEHDMDRRMSSDLGPIMEDPQHEQDEEDNSDAGNVSMHLQVSQVQVQVQAPSFQPSIPSQHALLSPQGPDPVYLSQQSSHSQQSQSHSHSLSFPSGSQIGHEASTSPAGGAVLMDEADEDRR
ncbi:NAD-dependent histone deacetylase sir2 [Mortierella polycephala]|uniref:NAD-dependent histone deacetylase sir2 n=1 Tax=Mortierella polycephala TaxID=41804 RepID=A0A9P6QKG5_9FUNG|nr:NAD-dependent histone deacetylase sir2 [Mortierella polycephala]